MVSYISAIVDIITITWQPVETQFTGCSLELETSTSRVSRQSGEPAEAIRAGWTWKRGEEPGVGTGNVVSNLSL